MVEILKSNWFVILIAVIILSFVVYFVYDNNKYNVSGKSVDGQDLLASVADTNITADYFYEEEQQFDASLLYQMYKRTILSESIEVTSDMKSDAKTLESTIRTNFENSYGDDYETTLNQQLATYGVSGDNALYDYCLSSELEKQAYHDYIEDNYDTEAAILKEKSPRTISILYIVVTDPDNLTEDEQTKKDDIDATIESDGFKAAVTAFSEDTDTVEDEGFYGYIDSDDVSESMSTDSTATIDGSVVSAALNLKKGETSDWITVYDSNGYSYLYKVYVNQTNLKKLFNSSNDDVKDQTLYAFINADSDIEYNTVETLASKLDITFKDDETETKIKDYIKSQKSDSTDEEESE